ncbi:MAG: hypothetical protein HYX36_09600 [Rhizobiales bacterium]|nr:hypothetical protein [Hyphomicrobiales bacterium]
MACLCLSTTPSALAKSKLCRHTFDVMPQPLIRRMLVMLLAVFLTGGFGLSAVQASSMSITMMDMAPGMGNSANGKCLDCESPGGSKGMAACVAPACAGNLAARLPSLENSRLGSMAVHHPRPDRALLGRGSEPDPYPPRTIDIA